MRRLLPFAIVSILLVAAGSAQAAPAITGKFNLPDQPSQTHPAVDSSGNVWVTFSGGDPDFVKVQPDGTVTPYNDPAVTGAGGIVFGPDGNLWVTLPGAIDKFSPADPTNGTKTPISDIITANTIIVGPDSNLWTGSNDKVLKISPASPATPGVFPSNIANFVAKGITANGGKIWVANADNGAGGILPVSLDGTIGTQLLVGATQVQDVATGPPGLIGYTAPTNPPERIGLINNGVLATPFITPPIDPFGIIYARDEAFWVTQFGGDNVARYTPSGEYTIAATFPTGSGPRFLTEGPNGTIWVVLEQSKEIVRISGVETPDSQPPAISKLKLSNKKFKVGAKKTALVARKKTPIGTTVSYTLSENATATIEIQKATGGRKSGKSCVKPTKKLKKAKKCTRYVAYKEKLTRLQLAGPNKVAFSGRFGKTKLKAGKYRFSITATDARGNTSKPSTIKFTVSTK